ncbi:MAG TPA: BON domain-containing protein [Gemmatimonadales bacterium]|nr:BON domain-containing protein [Gemmatimonadales bacterium]
MRGRYRGGRSRGGFSGERRNQSQREQGGQGYRRGYPEGGWGDEREWEGMSGGRQGGMQGGSGSQGYQGSQEYQGYQGGRYGSEGGYDDEEGGYEGRSGYGRQSRWGTREERSFPGSSSFGSSSGGYGRGQEGEESRGYQGGRSDESSRGGSQYSRQQGPHTGRGPKGYQRSDERIREDVSEALSRHGHIDASEITVEVRGGEVTLTGTVDNRDAKREAERAVENEPGVKEVQNQLRVQQKRAESQSQGSESTTSQRSGVPSADSQSESRGRSRSSSSLGANV